VIASETANNAEVEGSLIPLLTLGIPGAPQAAVLYQITKILVSAAITCTVFYVVFVIFFNVPFPAGWLY
jgi:TctA family transporter